MMKLITPNSFTELSEKEILATTNGCGAQGWKIDLVPDKIKGVDISLPCRIHDHMYNIGVTQSDKDLADITLFLNLLITIFNSSLSLHRKHTAYSVCHLYYEAVSEAGDNAFWRGKTTKPLSMFDKIKRYFANG